MYQLIRSVFFWFDAEKVHYFAMNALRFFCSVDFIKKILAANFQTKNKALAFESWGLEFKNRVGLAAGFDKNAKYLRELEVLGFGCVEIGTVTPKPQDGNDKPRLFRLPKDKAIINRMGFNNEGVKVVAERLKKWRENEVRSKKYDSSGTQLITHHSSLIIGGNIGKNKVTPNEDAWKDYEICFNELFDYVDYFVVNVSSPNTPGLRELQEKDSLRKILSHLQTLRTERLKLKTDSIVEKPILLKIAPDLTQSQLDDVIDLAREIQLDGLVASNTTISREGLTADAATVTAIGAGGLSGLPVKQRSTEIVQYITQKTNGVIPVIASGGIFTSADANEKLNAGAVLVQVWTGFIYEGPGIAKKICNNIHQ
ncbi:quinone-dependent dihydroorotate dehydrogenase [Lacibacter luteus]|uniref:Dihydroorotate dehydrogenase (quinone) n=1 Tax=Lacibacter luteus TaxID=2508719 RepID=A0A4Q1CI71_9BACT|nr:quinone-dependent dihydroorotate dehydrogenase [Lacibacter luteus]RXK60000.1 quinone-dependent dihydroorotate dehydrogenase [Lacibacter luteus]